MTRWNHQKWGRATDLIHQSDLYGLIGKFGCPEQFRRKKTEAAQGKRTYETANGKLTGGVAVHAVLHRILRSPPAVAAMLNPEQHFSRSVLEKAYDDEFDRERRGREVSWYKTSADKLRNECVSMLVGVLEDMRNHVGEVVAVECGFVFHVDGIWLTGATDIIYRPPGLASLGLGDWKTGAQKPHQIDLDHGWQSGIYAGAMRHGYFVRFENVECLPGEEHRDALERVCSDIGVAWQATIGDELAADNLAGEPDDYTRQQWEHNTATLARLVELHKAERFDEYPERIRYVHLRDYIPYSRKSKRMLERPEELAWAGLEAPAQSSFEKGDRRGPAWYHVQRSESDAPRLRHLLRAVVSWVRFGRFPAAPGEMCSRCRFREPCLLDGYKPVGDEKKQLEQATASFDFDGFGDLNNI